MNEEGLLGDSLMTIPFMIHLAKKQPAGTCFLTMKNWDVANLIPKKYGIRPVWEMTGSTAHTCVKLDISTVFARCGGQHMFHPTVGFFKLYNETPPNERAIQPEIEFEVKDEHPAYDYVISAMSRANGVRMWPLDEWRKLIPQLPGSVCMVGSADEAQPFEGIDYYLGHSLQDVAAVLSKAKCVITIDNGISRLTHAVGANHILLCSNVVGEVWGSYPGATLVYDGPKNFGVDRVLALAKAYV